MRKTTKILAFDSETTGLEFSYDEIIQLSALMIIDRKIESSINLLMRPFEAKVSAEAAAIHGHTQDMVNEYCDPSAAFANFNQWLSQYIDKYDKTDKAFPLAYNGSFDMSFLFNWYKLNSDNYLGSWIYTRALLDPLALARILFYEGKLPMEPDLKLKTLADYFKIPITAHDALSDITATWEVWKKLEEIRNSYHLTMSEHFNYLHTLSQEIEDNSEDYSEIRTHKAFRDTLTAVKTSFQGIL